MNALTPDKLNAYVEGGIFQTPCTPSLLSYNPFALGLTILTTQMNAIAPAMNQMQAEIDSAAYIMSQGQKMMRKNLGLGS